MKDGKATGVYEDFMTGFVPDKDTVWGGRLAFAVAENGALLVSEDASRSFALRRQFDKRGSAPTTIVGYFQGGGSRLT